tara:strand:+ start:307 stop:525 length:219 start_codon:yes stop_codon:yes gene_type:complete
MALDNLRVVHNFASGSLFALSEEAELRSSGSIGLCPKRVCSNQVNFFTDVFPAEDTNRIYFFVSVCEHTIMG